MAHVRMLACLLMLVVLAAPAGALDEEDLVGTWIGTSAENKGETLVLMDDGSATLDGAALTWRAFGKDRIRYKIDGVTQRGRYTVTRERLVVTMDGVEYAFERKGAAKATKEKAGGNPLASSGNPLAKKAAAPDPFARRFEGDGLVLELTQASAGYEGTLARDGDAWPVQAKSKDTVLTGTFTVGGERFEFAGELAGDRLTLESGGTTYVMQGAELAPGGSQAPPRLTGIDTGRATHFGHPQGWFSFEMPDGWSVAQETDEGLLLNPGLTATDTLDALVFLTFGELDQADRNVAPAALIDRYASDFRKEMKSQGIRLDRTASKAKAVLVGEVPGGVGEWTGSIESGQKVSVWLGAIVKREYYLTVSAVIVDGHTERFLPRTKRIFFTLEAKPPQRNHQLERALAGRSVASNETNESGSFSTIYDFDAQGGVKKTMIMSSSIGGSTSEEWGRYEVVGSELYMFFEDGQSSGTVVVEGGQLSGVRFGSQLYFAR